MRKQEYGSSLKRKNWKRFLGVLLFFSVVFSIRVMAALPQELVAITQNNQLVDTFNGVEARYALSNGDGDTFYSCAAFVKRYYLTVYGIDVYNLFSGSTPLVSGNNGSFSVTSSPEPGDIGSTPGHWFIIKEVNGDGTYTLIEQNYKFTSNGTIYTYKNRHIAASSVTVFRWSGKAGTVSLDNNSLSVWPGDTAVLQAKLENVTTETLKWSSDNSGIVSVENGKLAAKSVGTAHITASLTDTSGKVVSKAVCTVTVKQPTIKLNYPSATIYGNEKLQLTATVEGPSQTVAWKCSSSMYFSVNSSGLVGLGSKETLQTVSATITATANGVSATCTVTRKPGILEFSKSSCTLNAGSTSTLTAKTKGVNSVKYFSSNTAVATVNSSTGKVTAKKEGKAVITAKSGSVTASYTVNVKPTLQLNKSSLILNQKKSAKLTATVKGSSKKVTWSSSNSKVVSVSSSGKVTAKKAGKATISVTLKSSSGNITKTCSVTVLKPSIKLNIAKTSVYMGKSVALKAVVTGTSQKVTWKSSKKSVASVNSRGVVTAKKKGTATIYATANGVTAKCKIVVKPVYTKKQAEKGLKKYVTKKETTNFYYFYEGKTGDEYTFWVTFRGPFTKMKYFVNAKTGKIYESGIYFGVNEWKSSDKKRYVGDLSKYL